MFHYTVETTKSVEEAIAALGEALKEHRFGILWQLDLTETLRSKGLAMDRPYRVLEVCNPHEAKAAVDTAVEAGYFLPCKIVVYEDGGKTKIGLPKPPVLMDLVERPELRPIAERVEQALIQAIEAAK
ncbi:DUF302 domain-containing protein [Hydrogenibacillus schlegelii]|nr:DUF302 domain-containing protein [Hydrogenibacillus schlegelii]KWX07534.1 hypothetical protein TR75_02750 [Hydrogenibacillus schlegelii]MBE3562396.1 DUF302 domain-containing protein [Hydrogenibacillus schlegelii]MBT9281191.1 DUF302 domain-containing protein [Hydrogenibacillus schlegelii]OAR03595.1 hypothetical protein SA87_02895 [Hydrogenibacillus schlegelii]